MGVMFSLQQQFELRKKNVTASQLTRVSSCTGKVLMLSTSSTSFLSMGHVMTFVDHSCEHKQVVQITCPQGSSLRIVREKNYITFKLILRRRVKLRFLPPLPPSTPPTDSNKPLLALHRQCPGQTCHCTPRTSSRKGSSLRSLPAVCASPSLYVSRSSVARPLPQRESRPKLQGGGLSQSTRRRTERAAVLCRHWRRTR